jgi:hypothetical protein
MLYQVLRDAAFNSDQPEQYHLSVELSSDGIMYVLLHKPSQTYHLVSPFQPTANVAALEDIIKNDEFLKVKWSSVSVMIASKEYLLMPQSATQNASVAETIYRFQYATSAAQRINNQNITESDIAIIYASSNELSSLISKYFAKAQVTHHAVAFLGSMLKFQNMSTIEGSVHVQFHSNFIDIAILKHKQVQFCNSFRIQTPEDAIYFIMNAFHHSDLKASKTSLKVSGLVSDKSDTRRLLEKYFPTIQFEKIDTRTSYRYPFETNDVHTVINLLNLHHCA